MISLIIPIIFMIIILLLFLVFLVISRRQEKTLKTVDKDGKVLMKEEKKIPIKKKMFLNLWSLIEYWIKW